MQKLLHSDPRVLNMQQMKLEIGAEIQNFLGHSFTNFDHISGDPFLSGSLLGYGIPATFGKSQGKEIMLRLVQHIQQSLPIFEPRLDPYSLIVTLDDADLEGAKSRCVIEISGQLNPMVWIRPNDNGSRKNNESDSLYWRCIFDPKLESVLVE